MVYFYNYLIDLALMIINEKSTVDDAKAERDLIDIVNTIHAVQQNEIHIDFARDLHAKLYREYEEIADICKVASAMKNFSVVQNIYIKSELEDVIDNLKLDYYGIVASVLIKHKKMKSVTEFIEKVD